MSKDSPNSAQSTASRSAMHPRHDQIFPTLSADEIERVCRLGSVKRYVDGEALLDEHTLASISAEAQGLPRDPGTCGQREHLAPRFQ